MYSWKSVKGLLRFDDCPAGATAPMQKNVSGSSSKAQQLSIVKAFTGSLSLKRLFSAHVRSILDIKKEKKTWTTFTALQICHVTKRWQWNTFLISSLFL